MWYLSVTSLVFIYWLSLFLLDRETPKNHLISWIVLVAASFLWPISVPGAMIELANKIKLNEKLSNQEKEA